MPAPHVEHWYVWFGKRVRLHRERQGLTQAQLGDRLIPPQTRASVANIESAKQRVLALQVMQLARALQVSPAVLYGFGETERSGAESGAKGKVGR